MVVLALRALCAMPEPAQSYERGAYALKRLFLQE
jgi:hypothetical protein